MNIGEYRVIYRDRESEPWVCFVAEKRCGGRFRLYELPRGSYMEALIPFLSRENEDGAVFSWGGRTYFMLDYPEGRPLSDLGLEEARREGLPAAILEAFIMSGMTPEYAAALTPGHVLIKRDGEIGFDIPPPIVTRPVEKRDAFEAVEKTLKAVWPAPPDEKGRRWLSSLRSGEYETLCRAWADMPLPKASAEPEPKREPSRFERLRERLPMVLGAVFAAFALVLFLWAFVTAPREEPPPGDIRRIGDMIVAEPDENTAGR